MLTYIMKLFQDDTDFTEVGEVKNHVGNSFINRTYVLERKNEVGPDGDATLMSESDISDSFVSSKPSERVQKV